MTDTHRRLPVGYFQRSGGSTRYEEVEGSPMAERYLDLRSGSSPPARVATLHERLFGSAGGGPYAVHTVLQVEGEELSFLGRLERYQRWAEVMLNHPALAAQAGGARSA
jgi:hypothetical protein